jgi:hypothetical protein
MPTIYRYLGFLFRFFTNEHLPIHVHVEKQDRESKIEFNYTVEGLVLTAKKITGKTPLTAAEIKESKEFLTKYHLQVVTKWNQVYIFKKTIKCETINKKI